MILVMKTMTAKDVEGSDNLRVYTFAISEVQEITVVANRTNVYQVGDVVAVALVGSTPVHFGNFEVTKRKVFGIESFGMAVGTTDLPIGTQLDDDWNPGS